jgi:hypothetical protein
MAVGVVKLRLEITQQSEDCLPVFEVIIIKIRLSKLSTQLKVLLT